MSMHTYKLYDVANFIYVRRFIYRVGQYFII